MDFNKLSEAMSVWRIREQLVNNYNEIKILNRNTDVNNGPIDYINYGGIFVTPTQELHDMIMEQARSQIDEANAKLLELGVTLPDDLYGR